MAGKLMHPEDRRRSRRRLRRQAAVLMFLLMAFALAWFFESQATTTILFARYAEVDRVSNPQDTNPGLSAAGHARAAELARFVGQIDVVAGVDAIFATQYRSTQETAEPLAQQLRLKVHVVDVSEVNDLLERILREFKGKVVLVVTHPEPMPVLIRELHGSKKVPPMAADEHDNLYVVSIPWYGKVKTLRLKYGAPHLPPAALPAVPTPAPAAQ